ncbi:PadR family transcriptional regulator [Arthrobacter sp. zg-Y20]|uniref:PadR family transcriptional regulator n=1 Tax=unclassified Arthrobacter TaxID=235627 RepID=UPI001D14BD2E|nr:MULTISPECIES: PadR family transcriptional regulator [unclassified Arthrobacter]MCC3276252.1 PadR family transcriptional regulator [Arthrobacter sp. zg-Y20]MDK1316412.1 PadR family transcriptional regulator [Arthrobacter sp. zg.Y20]WIB06458.1 PadR family transcriptional regulator [Arthrobacter sp. zg-Y20]
MTPTAESILTQLRKGTVDYCVLACLRSGPAYGLEIAERLGEGEVLFASGGTLYPLLSRLRQQGWVITTLEPSPVGPPRRYYHLTDAGESALKVFTRTWHQFAADVTTMTKETS